MLLVNLCRGYCVKGDYQGAQRQLELAEEKKLIGIQRSVYLADCAYVAFYLGEDDHSHEDFDYLKALLWKNGVE